MRLTRIFLLSFLLLPLSACGLSGGPIEGRVLEVGTNKPIPGAIVVVRWTGSMFAFVESQTKCVHVETATTDAEGYYKVAFWVGTFPGWIQDLRPDATAYKVGYMRSPEYFKQQSYRKNVELMEPFKGLSGERLEYLARLHGSTGCGAQNGSEKNRLLLLKALYEEARSLGDEKKPVPNQMSIAEAIRYDMETLEFGFEEAEKRHLKRP